MLIWVCDLEHFTRALNDPDRVGDAEEFLKRFFWLSSRLLRSSGALLQKWTGDGFLSAFPVVLDRALGRVAFDTFDMAWQLTVLCNTTNLGVQADVRWPLRHGIACDPDAIVVRAATQIDVIGRGVVMATRLAGLAAPFPRISVEGRIARAVADISLRHKFARRVLRKTEILQYFKGERCGTHNVAQSSHGNPRRYSARTLLQNAKKAIASAEQSNQVAPAWLIALQMELQSGPPWARQVHDDWTAYMKNELLASVKRLVTVMEPQ